MDLSWLALFLSLFHRCGFTSGKSCPEPPRVWFDAKAQDATTHRVLLDVLASSLLYQLAFPSLSWLISVCALVGPLSHPVIRAMFDIS